MCCSRLLVVSVVTDEKKVFDIHVSAGDLVTLPQDSGGGVDVVGRHGCSAR
jgi:hypothetical protein